MSQQLNNSDGMCDDVDDCSQQDSQIMSTTQIEVSTVHIRGTPMISLLIDDKERLCLAQISNTLLKNYNYNEIHNRRVALGINCIQCTPVQLEILRRAGAMPISSRRCGMITKREAERLVTSFLEECKPPSLPENFVFNVNHKCGFGSRGTFYPVRYNSSRAKCIRCYYCDAYFSPNKFIFHSHREHSTIFTHADTANFNSWRRHLVLSSQTTDDKLINAWEDVKAIFNGGTRKRMIPTSEQQKRNSISDEHDDEYDRCSSTVDSLNESKNDVKLFDSDLKDDEYDAVSVANDNRQSSSRHINFYEQDIHSPNVNVKEFRRDLKRSSSDETDRSSPHMMIPTVSSQRPQMPFFSVPSFLPLTLNTVSRLYQQSNGDSQRVKTPHDLYREAVSSTAKRPRIGVSNMMEQFYNIPTGTNTLSGMFASTPINLIESQRHFEELVRRSMYQQQQQHQEKKPQNIFHSQPVSYSMNSILEKRDYRTDDDRNSKRVKPTDEMLSIA